MQKANFYSSSLERFFKHMYFGLPLYFPACPLMERAIEHRDNNDYRTVLLEYISMEWIHHCTQTTYLCYYSMTFHFIRVVLFVLHFVWLLLKKVVLLIDAKVVVIFRIKWYMDDPHPEVRDDPPDRQVGSPPPAHAPPHSTVGACNTVIPHCGLSITHPHTWLVEHEPSLQRCCLLFHQLPRNAFLIYHLCRDAVSVSSIL